MYECLMFNVLILWIVNMEPILDTTEDIVSIDYTNNDAQIKVV